MNDDDFSARDVPSPIDLRDPHDARVWADEADQKRPWRAGFRARFAMELRAHTQSGRVLELGSGPGLLVECILASVPVRQYVLYDFSEPMLAMSSARLFGRENTEFMQGDFTLAEWSAELVPPFDAIVAMQSVHEIRHKRHVPQLYTELHALLAPGGLLLVCDHAPSNDSSRTRNLMMTEAEQRTALAYAMFRDVRTLMVHDNLYLYRALAR